MKFEILSKHLETVSTDCLVIFTFEKEKGDLDLIFPAGKFGNLKDQIKDGIKFEDFKGKMGQVLNFQTYKKILAPKILVLGLGKKEEFDQNSLRDAISILSKKTTDNMASIALSLSELANLVDLDRTILAQVVSEGILLGNYNFFKYKSKKTSIKTFELVILSELNKNSQLKLREGIKLGEIYARATIVARDLVNEPSSLVTPLYLAKFATELAKKKTEIKCKIYDKEEIEKMGMGAFLGIAQAAGSDVMPKFIYLEYIPKNPSSKKKLAIVGKGITFDSGGISVKTGDSMQTMKMDMAGAAAVLGVFSVIEQIKPTYPVMGIIAATPNLISAKSIVPGDVVKAMNGKTIEILNTDAEGRVTMADSLSFAVKNGATEIIDLATLTGACMVALGEDIAGLFSNNKILSEKILKASESSGEKVWEMPLTKEYKKLNKSDVADVSNIPSTRYGGAITAALFLEEFVDNKPWAHIDIAGPAFAEKEYSLGPKGGTGFGVRFLLNLLNS